MGGALLTFSGGAADTDFAAARKRMVASQIAGRGVTNTLVLNEMAMVPRHEFVPVSQRPHAYDDTPLPIGNNQTISQPYMVALMTEQLAPKGTDRFLEVGTGSGYQAAVLSRLAKEVYTIEIIESLGRRAEADLNRLGYTNVHVRIGDGYQGWPEAAPFDGIIVTCAPDHVPKPLTSQLREGGRLVIPVGGAFEQSLHLLEKKNGKLVQKGVLPVRFVPMTGKGQMRE